MAIRSIRLLPDPILRTRTRRVQQIDESIHILIQDMIDTMRHAHGVGLAANQVGVPLRVCVIEIPEEEQVWVLINPEMVARRGERELEEGCLSIPGYRGQVRRSHEVRIRALDQHGKPVRIKAADNLLAQALEHELGHLNGEMYIDHLVNRDSIWKITPQEPHADEAAETDATPSAANPGLASAP